MMFRSPGYQWLSNYPHMMAAGADFIINKCNKTIKHSMWFRLKKAEEVSRTRGRWSCCTLHTCTQWIFRVKNRRHIKTDLNKIQFKFTRGHFSQHHRMNIEYIYLNAWYVFCHLYVYIHFILCCVIMFYPNLVLSFFFSHDTTSAPPRLWLYP